MVRDIKIFLFFFFLSIYFTPTYGQGELFTREDANQRFGPVLKSIDLPLSTFSNLAGQTSAHLMFRIQDNNVIVLDGQRNVIYPVGTQINSQDVFSVYSVSVINELITNGNETSVSIEQRQNVLSISYGQMTMEVGGLCPPICP